MRQKVIFKVAEAKFWILSSYYKFSYRILVVLGFKVVWPWWPQWPQKGLRDFFFENMFLKSVHSKKRDEACPGFLILGSLWASQKGRKTSVFWTVQIWQCPVEPYFLGTFCVTKTITTVKQYCVKSRKVIFILILEHKWRCWKVILVWPNLPLLLNNVRQNSRIVLEILWNSKGNAG